MALADGAHLADIFHGDGLASAGVVGDGEHDERDALAAYADDQGFECGDIHIALKGMRRGGVLAFFDHQIDGLGSDEFDIGGVVSKCVLFGMTSPFLQVTPKRMRSAARP